MAIKGRNIYVNGVRWNDSLIPDGVPFTIEGLQSDNDYEITATNVDFAGNESDPSSVLIASTLPYVWSPDDPLSEGDANAIDALVAAHRSETGAPGVMVAITGPKGRYLRAYGRRGSSGSSAPLTLDDHFRIGSITKTVTAHAILMLIEQGVLSFDDTLSQFFSGIPNGDQITIRHMLTHTSGLYEYLNAVGIWMSLFPTMSYSELSFLTRMRISTPQFAPGAQFKYTNTNYVFLGLIIREVTGVEARDWMRQNIFEPLEMFQMSWPTNSNLPAPYSDGVSVTRFNPEWARGSGALVSTMGDLVAWTEAMRDGVLLSPSMREEWGNTFVELPNPGDGPDVQGYGYGVVSFGNWLGHNGAIPGFECQSMFDYETGAVVAVMQNKQASPSTIGKLWFKIVNHLYPDSLRARDYRGRTFAPSGASVSVTPGLPLVVLDEPHKVVAPAAAGLVITRGAPIIGGAIGVECEAAELSITMGTPEVDIAEGPSETIILVEENVNRTEREIPEGATGVYVTLIGGGGGGASGFRYGSSFAPGGGGGGGGGKLDRIYIPGYLFGDKYTLFRGTGGAGGAGVGLSGIGTSGVNGGYSFFVMFNSLIGDWTLLAAGGTRGASTVAGSTGGSGGVAGTTTSALINELGAEYIDSHCYTGGKGGDGGWDGTAGEDAADNTDGAPAGGGGGGGSNGNITDGGDGGDTIHVSGGAGGSGSQPPGAPPDGGLGESGAGGGGGTGRPSENATAMNGANGGIYGGGGGGGGGLFNTTGASGNGGNGADGYVKLEWVSGT